MPLMQGKKTLVLGPSGAGKSSLTNLLIPHAQVLTAEISQALNSGKHTTTSTTLYWIDADRSTALIDSPGFQEFGLHHIEPMHLAAYMPDIKAHAQNCKFYNCTHLHEPGCGVINELKSNTKGRFCCSFTHAGLQNPELSALDREFDIAKILIMGL